MAAKLFFLPHLTATVNGIAVPGAKASFYQTGTTTPLTVYQDGALSVPHSSPVVANGAGRFPAIYLDDTVVYRLILTDGDDAELAGGDIDPYLPGVVPDASILQPYQDACEAAAAAASASADDADASATTAAASATTAANAAADALTAEANSEAAAVLAALAADAAQNAAGASFATAAEIRAGTLATKPIAPDQLVLSAAFQSLTDAATTNWDMALGYNATWTVGGNRTLATPTNPKEGLTYSLKVVQDATGSRTVTWPAAFDWGSAGTPTLSTAAGKKDLVMLQCLDAGTPSFRAMFSKAG